MLMTVQPRIPIVTRYMQNSIGYLGGWMFLSTDVLSRVIFVVPGSEIQDTFQCLTLPKSFEVD